MSSTLNKTTGFLEGVSVKPKKELLGRDVLNCPWNDWDLRFLVARLIMCYVAASRSTVYTISDLCQVCIVSTFHIISSWNFMKSSSLCGGDGHLKSHTILTIWQVMNFFCITFLSWRLIMKPPHPPEMIAIHLIVSLNGLCAFRNSKFKKPIPPHTKISETLEPK